MTRRTLVALAGLCAACHAAEPTPGAVLAALERTADWQLSHPSHWKPLQWENAVFYTGVMALSKISPRPAYRDAMTAVGRDNQWGLGPRAYDADDQCVGQTYAELYLQARDPRMIAPLRTELDLNIAHPKEGSLEFDSPTNPDHRDRWSWCDSLFMAPPAWARLSAATGDKAYLDAALRRWWRTSDFLFDAQEHLFYRDSTYFQKREANGAKVFWSRGNGWVLAGTARVLEFMPEDHPSRPRLVEQFREIAERVRGCQQPDGLWRASLLDPKSFPMKETSASALFCYALAWGIDHGILDSKAFRPAVMASWQAIGTCVTPEGRLTHVQPVGKTPAAFEEDSTEPFGVGAFLLAGTEVHALLSRESPKR